MGAPDLSLAEGRQESNLRPSLSLEMDEISVAKDHFIKLSRHWTLLVITQNNCLHIKTNLVLSNGELLIVGLYKTL